MISVHIDRSDWLFQQLDDAGVADRDVWFPFCTDVETPGNSNQLHTAGCLCKINFVLFLGMCG